MKQMTLAATRGFEKHNRATRKAEFLARMDRLMPWAEFCAVIEPHYPKAGNGRPPVGLERMLRMYCVANWFNLADEACEDALYDVPVFREFCRIDLGRERVPDATTLLHFRHLLERHDLGAAMFAKIGELLLANGMKLSGGTIVDATLIAAPPSTKNQEKSRDPEMHQTKKGNEWHFGMKLHIGTDSQSGLVHSASVTAANVHDSHQVPNLLHGAETRFYGDSAYRGQEQRKRLKVIAPKAKDFTNKRAYRNNPLTDADKETNRRKSSVRSKVEHPFLTVKRLWGFAKVRYRGLAKNANRAFAMLAMLNVSMWARPLTGEVRPA
ncbi:IS5 family transposase [Sulfuritalea hydrogenivorans]|jgi:IS5 family transposase|uniref:IS4 family transposase n=1 Tax=Sulfuritalea hydrogenivorans sk43H TaxID=1223802 RepID=W0SE97_9PROT|nr:IS5 family transposase [Sulfuritalea hydrogenivorans]BAO28931.1 IS4 family transposase [Sulfuritalea hydrogenivorans sk43H]BAO29257.1 IS4 family transposase [Sulfuritalea hydrogenivorans sk43H]BAO30409.1 IS4 family transposase [Sulfuritalea hydrogenivorans sk43H]BAO30727.1 IS4 family transposase [Sulfuritalea hydrogenivorans sk43H]BAO30912.1 IS4 family transposase [Sulfuritalea hydrogenivorans sk43H]